MPAQHPLRFFVAFFLLLGVLSWWPGEATAKSTAPDANEPLTRANNFGRPVLTPEQVLQGVLRLAEAVPKQRQLTPEMVKEATGIWLTLLPNKPEEGGFVGNLTMADWRYSFDVFSDALARGRIFQIRFFPRSGIDERSMSFDAVCPLSLSNVDQVLHRIGYIRQNSLSGRRISYRHGDVGIQIISTFSKTAYCVQYMSVYLPNPVTKGKGNE